MLPPPCFTVGMMFFGWWAVLGFRQMYRLGLRPNSYILVSSDHNTFSHLTSESSRCVLAKLSRKLMRPFLSGFLSCNPPIQATFVEHAHNDHSVINSCNCFKVAVGLLVAPLTSSSIQFGGSSWSVMVTAMLWHLRHFDQLYIQWSQSVSCLCFQHKIRYNKMATVSRSYSYVALTNYNNIFGWLKCILQGLGYQKMTKYYNGSN